MPFLHDGEEERLLDEVTETLLKDAVRPSERGVNRSQNLTAPRSGAGAAFGVHRLQQHGAGSFRVGPKIQRFGSS
jgi:hypothetical protein